MKLPLLAKRLIHPREAEWMFSDLGLWLVMESPTWIWSYYCGLEPQDMLA